MNIIITSFVSIYYFLMQRWPKQLPVRLVCPIPTNLRNQPKPSDCCRPKGLLLSVYISWLLAAVPAIKDATPSDLSV